MDPEMAVDTSTPLLTHSTLYLRTTYSKVVEEFKELYAIALPLIFTGLLIYGKSAISMVFMGRLGKIELAGGSLSIGIANITGYSILSGLAMGMDSISSQAFGANQWPLMCQTLQRTTTMLLSFCVPIAVLWLKIEPVLLFFGQNPTICSIASIYLTFSIPDLVFQSLINPIKVYLRAQSITLPLMLTAAFSLSVHAPVNYLLVCRFKLGVRGVAMAATITDLILLISILVYIFFSGTYVKWLREWSLFQCFVGWKPILELAIPSCLSVCLEWWWYELMVLLASLISAEAVATMGILIQATSFLYIFPSSLSLAVSTRVGNQLGASQPGKAKASAFIALACAVFTSFIAMVFMISSRNIWGRAFSSDKTILSLTSAVMPVVGLCEIGNWPQTTGCGVLRGSARPKLGANVNLISFYGFGFPLAILMGFVMKMGLVGLWLGLLAAQFVCAFLMVFYLIKTDWEVEANRANKLTGVTEDEERENETENDEEKAEN